MKVILDLCVVPMGVGVSVSRHVAACETVLKEAGLKTHLHAYGTNIEGDWDEVFAAVKQCHEAVHEMGAPRITTTIKVGTRVDRDQTMEDKVRSVERKLALMGLAALIIWFMFLLLAVVLSGGIFLQRGRRGLKWAVLPLLGAALTFAFVSVVIGFLEQEGYSKSIGFVFTMGIGVTGLFIFGAGVTKLRR